MKSCCVLPRLSSSLRLRCRAVPCGRPTEQRSRSMAHGKAKIRRKQKRSPSPGTAKFPVPGLAHSAQPAFPQVDQFDSRMLIQNRGRSGEASEDRPRLQRRRVAARPQLVLDRRTFEISETKSVAILRINKAQFGAAVWLNGVKIGDHLPCFTAAILDVSKAIRRGTNEAASFQRPVFIRAHPSS